MHKQIQKHGRAEKRDSSNKKILKEKSVHPIPKTVEECNNLAVWFLSKDRFDEAEKVLKRGLKLAPDDVDLWTNLGIVYAQMDKTNAAENALKKALKLDPENTTILVNLSNVYSKQRKYKESIEILQKLAADSNDPAIHLNLGRIYITLGNKVKAKEEIKLALSWIEDEGLRKYAEELVKGCE